MISSEERSDAVKGTPSPIQKIATVKVRISNARVERTITIVGDVEDAVKGTAMLMAGQQFREDTKSSIILDSEILSISYEDYK